MEPTVYLSMRATLLMLTRKSTRQIISPEMPSLALEVHLAKNVEYDLLDSGDDGVQVRAA